MTDGDLTLNKRPWTVGESALNKWTCVFLQNTIIIVTYTLKESDPDDNIRMKKN